MFKSGISNYNPEADPNAIYLGAGDAHIYLVDEMKLAQNVFNDGGESKFTLEGAQYNGPIVSSSLILQQVGINRPVWHYNGRILLDPAAEVSNYEYLQASMDVFRAQEDRTFDELYFNNVRHIFAKTSQTSAILEAQLDDNKINYYNNATLSGLTHPDISIGLNAPSLKKLDMKPIGQLRSHVRNYVLALNALSQIVEGRPLIETLIITPDGPLYPAKSKGKYSKKPIADRRFKQNDDTTEPATDIDEVEEAPIIVDEVPKLMLDDLGGLEQIREELKQVVFSYKNPEIMAQWGAERPQGVLLYGPAGTGKTSLARALANEIDGELWEIKSGDIYDKWLGNSEKNMQAIFDKAHKKKGPTVMLFDEFDGLISPSDSGGSGGAALNAVVGIFKKEMTELRDSNPNIIVVATTNHYDKIDESLVRAGRFDVKAYVPLPDERARTQIFANNIADKITTLGSESFSPFADDIDTQALATASDDMSGADIVEVLRRVSFMKAMEQAKTGTGSPVTQAELLAGIKQVRQS